MNKTEYEIWRDYLLQEMSKRGFDKDAVRTHMEVEPEVYAAWFDDGMLPNQAADFAANILR